MLAKLMAVTGIFAAATASAVVFPDADGSHDFGLPSAWNSETLPATTEIVDFNTNGTFFSSVDMEFLRLRWGGSGVILDQTGQPAGRTVRFNGGSSAWSNPSVNRANLTLRSGVWDFGGVNIGPQGSGFVNDYKDCSLVIEGGAIVTNVTELRHKYNNNFTKPLTIRGTNTQVYCKRLYGAFSSSHKYDFSGDPSHKAVMLDIADGAYVRRTGGSTFWQPGGGVVLVRGEGTKVNVTGNYAYVGDQNYGVTHVTDHAQFIAGNLLQPNDASKKYGHLYVDNYGKVDVDVYYFTSWKAETMPAYQSCTIGSNGEMEVSNIFYMSGSNNVVTVSNGTLRINSLNFGSYTTSHDLTLKLYGPNAQFVRKTSGFMFGSGHHHKFIMDGGAKWSTGGIYLINGTGSSNRIEVVNGSELTVTEYVRFENYGSKASCVNGNTLYVANGATVTLPYCNMAWTNNQIVVSNATLTCTAKTEKEAIFLGGVVTPDKSPAIYPTNCALVVEGSTPKISVPNGGTSYLRYGSHLVFRIPKEGYAEGYVPMELGSFSCYNDSFIDVEGLEAMLQDLKDRGVTARQKFTLITTMVAALPTNNSEIMLRANAALPARCSLRTSDDRKSIVLTVRPEVGSVILIR